MSIIDEGGSFGSGNERRVRMAALSIVASHKVNGVAALHSQLMVETIFADYVKIYPDRFHNVTNGVTPRRWLQQANPGLSSLLDPLRRRDTVVARNRLDVAAMDAASQQLLGLHDFGAFCRKRAGATTVRTLLSFSWRRSPGGVVEGTVVADAFCHSMVRALVGSVVPVGDGRLGVDEPREVLRAAVRDPRITVMPPHGLSLEEVSYPPDADLAARAVEARSTRALPSRREERTRRVHRPADGVSSPLDGVGEREVG